MKRHCSYEMQSERLVIPIQKCLLSKPVRILRLKSMAAISQSSPGNTLLDDQSHPSNILQMNPSQDQQQQPPTNCLALENHEKKPAEPLLEVEKPGGGGGVTTVLDLASSSPPPDDFNPGWRFYASFTSLCIITLAVALDATTLSVALPVIRLPLSFLLSHIMK